MRGRFPAACYRAVVFTALIMGGSCAAQAWTLKTLHSFCSEANCADGDRPLAGLLRDSAGNLYGTTQFGGGHNSGTVFQLRRKGDGWRYRVLYSFCDEASCGDGSVIDARVIMDTSGNLYGTATAGGANNCGTVFRLSPGAPGGAWRLKTLHNFCATEADGRWPGTGLSYQGQASGAPYDGASPLYGTTRQGGATKGGTVFALVPSARGKWKEKVLHSFCNKAGCPDGADPLTDLLIDSGGDLFGTTSRGGEADKGLVFRLAVDAGKWKRTVLYSFCRTEDCADGGTPIGPLLQDASGAIIGGALEPGDEGVLYKLTPHAKGYQERVLHTFCGTCEDGYDPKGGVVMNAAGDLFGTAAFGGGLNGIGDGVVFKLSGRTYSVLYTFCSEQNCTDGVFPQAPVTLDPSGRIYGTTSGGLAEQRGSVFELIP